MIRPGMDATMADACLQEAHEDVSKATRDLHRALVSLQEELEAVDRYRQRADACRDDQLKTLLLHHMREEIEHAAMLVAWLRRADPDFDARLHACLVSDAPSTGYGQVGGGPGSGGPPAGRTIGALKE